MGLDNYILIAEIPTMGKEKIGKLDPITYTNMSTQATITTPATESTKTVKRSDKVKFSVNNLTGIAGQVKDALINAGFKGDGLIWALEMCYLESGRFTNALTKIDHNPGSIMYYPGAKKGHYVKANSSYAAHFDNFDDFAKQFHKELSKNHNPLGAKNLKDFVNRLKKNGYFGDEQEESYYNKMVDIDNHMSVIALLSDKTHEKPEIKKNWWDNLPLWGKIGIGIGGFLIIKKVLD